MSDSQQTPQDPDDLLSGLGSFGNHEADKDTLRNRVGRFYRRHDNLRSSGKTEAAYEALIFPNDRPAWRHQAADEMFSCALRFLSACRLLGVPHPILAEPYERRWKLGGAVVDCRRVAETYGALVTGKALESYEPQAGDALCSGTGNNVHVSCVVSATWQPGVGMAPVYVLDCSDGGQGHKGDMAVEPNIYAWEPSAIRSVEPPRSLDQPGARRPLVWVISMWDVVFNSGLLKA
jgi:hypothetical protein